jgi:hypothetical protein
MSRLRVIVLGWLIRGPAGGIAWHYLNYVLGLAELGHDVYYIEDSGDVPACYDAGMRSPGTDPNYGLHFAALAFNRLGLGDCWAYYDAPTKEWKGPRTHDARELCRSADLIINVSAANPLRDWLAEVPARVLIDTDPGFTQIRNLTDPNFRRLCEAHSALFSFGENIGKPCSAVPDDGFRWQATRQPVSADAWPSTPPPRHGRYTSVLTWESADVYEYTGVRVAGIKSELFHPYRTLPQRLGPIFELAVRGSMAALEDLRDAGWTIGDVDAIANDPWSYQAFIQASKAEFGIAKSGYVVTRSGWFSERSAVYLTTGRPVLAQDTGFPEWLPCGAGVFAFSSPEDVVQTIADIDSNYEMHCRAARDIAETYFAARRVLAPLIETAMAGPAVDRRDRNSDGHGDAGPAS